MWHCLTCLQLPAHNYCCSSLLSDFATNIEAASTGEEGIGWLWLGRIFDVIAQNWSAQSLQDGLTERHFLSADACMGLW